MKMTAEITTRDLRERFGAVRKRLAHGQSFVVTSQGQPVACLTPWGESHSLIGATVGGPSLPADLDEPTGEKW
jgi:antitoxin (DNA-binding transcriptional repressor) of toxin-antitoxin stability system